MIRIVLFTFVLMGLVAFANAQDTIVVSMPDASVEKYETGVQLGFLGFWLINEARVSKKVSIRAEVGFDAYVSDEAFSTPEFFVLVPVVIFEPRWYFNLQKRQSKSKRIDGNSGNYLSLQTSFHLDYFVITFGDNVDVMADFSLVPTFGIRRNIGKYFNYEAGLGVGYVHYIPKGKSHSDNLDAVKINLHLRIGYRFGQ